jgi:ABC-2 type transport system ATP-binding protein
VNLIEVDNLSKHFKILNRREGLGGAFKDLFSGDYRTVKAVEGVSFAIQEGEIVGYIGPNGAGKSTTIKMMTGILKPSGGTVLINGISPYENRIENARNMGVVFGQRTQLWWDLPVIESFKILKEIYRVDEATFQKQMALFNDLINL